MSIPASGHPRDASLKVVVAPINNDNTNFDDWAASVTSSFGVALDAERFTMNAHLQQCHQNLLSELRVQLRNHINFQSRQPEQKLPPIVAADVAPGAQEAAEIIDDVPVHEKKDLAWREQMRLETTTASGGIHAKAVILEDAVKDDVFRRLALHPLFDGFFIGLILLHTLQMALSAQYYGIEYGYVLNYSRMGTRAADAWPGVEDVLNVMDTIFAVAYTFELGVKCLGLRLRFFFSAWNVLDLFLVGMWYIDKFGSLDFIDTMVLRLARLGKLMRVVRHVGWLRQFDSLHMLISAISSSLSVLVWSSTILCAMLLLVALLTNGLLAGYLEDKQAPEDERREVYKYFGTFTRSFVTMFEMAFASHVPALRVIMENVDELYALYFLFFKLVVSLSLMKVISGVFMHETFKVCSEDDELMTIQKKRAQKSHISKMKALFARANVDGNDSLSQTEFIDIMEDDWVRTWLASMDLDVSNISHLWQVLDTSRNGQLSAHELVSGITKVKGPARSLDMQCSLLNSDAITHAVDDLRDLMKQMQSMQAGLNAKACEPKDKPNGDTVYLAVRPDGRVLI